jgi:hypothetical protein
MAGERKLTGAGLAVWTVLRSALGQVRAVGPVPVGLDWAAIHTQTAALGGDPVLMAECLPAVEPLVLKHLAEIMRRG